jgi:hypothetical protein
MSIPYLPSIAHLCSFSCPHKASEERRSLIIIGVEDVWLVSSIFEINDLFPKFTFICLVPLDPGG